MELAMIGLGRMGGNMVRRLLQCQHHVVAYNRSAEKLKEFVGLGAVGVTTLEDLVHNLKPPRTIWMMVPAGDAVTQTIDALVPLIAKGDVLIDGGNSNFKDTMRRASELKAKGIHYLDIGTSGGIWGLKVGYCMMVGGESEALKMIEPALKALAPADGYLHVGPSGAGHYVKMVHNGIEYGMMQAYAEGFEILKTSPFNLELKKVADLWNHGSVVRSWLLELAASAFDKDPNLDRITGFVQDSGEGRWTVQASIDQEVPAPIITMSLQMRFRSRQKESFGGKLLAALRNEFGGHAVQTK